MRAVVGALRVNMGLESGRFESGVDRVRQKTRQTGRSFDTLRRAGASLGKALSDLGLQYVGFLAIKDAFNRLMRQGSGEIDAVAKAARRLDGSVGGIRALELAASEAGVTAANLADEFSKLERSLVSGTENSRKAMQRLGLSVQDLDGKDIDARIALIADRINSLGLSSAETSHMLRQLGVTNQDMTLLLRQGGDAIREAREDIKDYRAELSGIDVQAVERGRDQINRLGIVIKSVSQEIIGKTVPRFGMLAQIVTDSMREGGRLREVVDLLLRSLDRLVVVAGVTALVFTTKYVAAMVIARLATLNLAAAIATLKQAFRTILITALIVGLSELVFLFLKLREAVGSAAEAFAMVRDVWSEVLDRMKMSLGLFQLDWQRFQARLKETWFRLLAQLQDSWVRFLLRIGPSINRLSARLGSGFRIDIIGAVEARNDLLKLAEEANQTQRNLRASFAELQSQIMAPFASIEAIRGALANLKKETIENESAVFKLSEGFVELGDAAENQVNRLQELSVRLESLRRQLDPSYGEAMRYAEGLRVLDDALQENLITTDIYNALVQKLGESFSTAAEDSNLLEDGLSDLEKIGQSVKRSMASAFSSIITGSQDAKSAIANLLRSIADLLVQKAVMSALGGFAIPGFARGTNFAPGGMALVGEQGPELINLPRGSQVTPAARTSELMQKESSFTVTPKIVNVLDPSLVGEFLNTRPGEEVIVNVLQRNGVL